MPKISNLPTYDGDLLDGTEEIPMTEDDEPQTEKITTNQLFTNAPNRTLPGSAIQQGAIDAEELNLGISPTWTGNHQFDGDMTLGMATINYTISNDSDTLTLTAEGSNNNARIAIEDSDLDGSQASIIELYTEGGRGATDSAFVSLNIVGGDTAFLRTRQNGTGTTYPITIKTGSNTDQLVCRTDGDLAMANSLKVGGTGSPSETLHVAGNTRSDGLILARTGGVGFRHEIIDDSDSNVFSVFDSGPSQVGALRALGLDGAGAGYLQSNNFASIRFNHPVTIGGNRSPTYQLDLEGEYGSTERSSDPSDPAEGRYVMWMSDGTGSGADGDIMVKVTAGDTTKTITLVDFSAN